MKTVTGTRKLIAGSVLLIVGVVISFVRGDIPEHLLSLMEMLYWAFVAGNAAEYFTNSKKKNNNEPV